MQKLPPGIDAFKEWIALGLTLVGAAAGFWRWLVRPLKQMQVQIRKDQREDSHDIRTILQTLTARMTENEFATKEAKGALGRIEDSQKEIKATQKEVISEIGGVKQRLTVVENDVKHIEADVKQLVDRD